MCLERWTPEAKDQFLLASIKQSNSQSYQQVRNHSYGCGSMPKHTELCSAWSQFGHSLNYEPCQLIVSTVDRHVPLGNRGTVEWGRRALLTSRSINHLILSSPKIPPNEKLSPLRPLSINLRSVSSHYGFYLGLSERTPNLSPGADIDAPSRPSI